MVAALQVEGSLVSSIFPAKPCFVQGVLDILYRSTRDSLLFSYSMLDNRRGVYKMKGERFKSEIARRQLSDLQRTLSAL